MHLIAKETPRDIADQLRGYSINLKMVVLAYTTEMVIAGASLIGAYIFAHTYGRGDEWQMAMMMLAPIAYAVIEVCRVPLALAVRTQPSKLIRLAALIGVIGAALVTVKSMSQLGEIMFRPRLFDVVHAKEQLDDARSAAADFAAKFTDAQNAAKQAATMLDSAEKQLSLATEKLGNLPEQKCMQTSGTTRDGRAYKGVQCSHDKRIDPLVAAVNSAKTDRDSAATVVASTRQALNMFDRSVTDKQVAATQLQYREAVLNSQLHSFTAMVFGINPEDVTDAQLHRFLRVFVFVPAICTAFAATLIAMAAVSRVKPKERLHMEEGAMQYILSPLATEIIDQAARRTLTAMQDAVTRAKPTIKPNTDRKPEHVQSAS